MQVTININLTEKQVAKIMQNWDLSDGEVFACLQELKQFAEQDPETFLENLDWFNF